MASSAQRAAALPPSRPDPLAVSGLGHAFDDDLHCPCGVTWSGHQADPHPCRLAAQRGHRPAARADGSGR